VTVWIAVDLRIGDTTASIITSYNSFVERIEALDLTDAAEAKPILDVCCAPLSKPSLVLRLLFRGAKLYWLLVLKNMVLGLAKPWPRLWSGSWSTHKELVTNVSCGWNTSVVRGIFVSMMIPQDLRASG